MENISAGPLPGENLDILDAVIEEGQTRTSGGDIT
jgi:hypothetical protein